MFARAFLLMAYLTTDRFKLLTLLPAAWVDQVETKVPGFTQSRLDLWSDWINARLRKRYPNAFGTPTPGIIELWLTRIVTVEVDLKRGVSPTDEQFQLFQKSYESAFEEIKEAANSETGLFDLPTTDDGTQTGLATSSVHSYSEASPYVSADVQARAARGEDRSRGGTGS